MRRLPVYLLLDSSGSMRGEPIESVNRGIQMIVSSLRQNPLALETVHLSVLTFDDEARVAAPLTELLTFQCPELRVEKGLTSLGKGLSLLAKQIENEVVKATATRKGDWRPLVFIMTDGEPTDDWVAGIRAFEKVKTGTVIACAMGKDCDTFILKKITENVLEMEQMDKASFDAYFQWWSSSVSAASERVNVAKGEQHGMSGLPSLPDKIRIAEVLHKGKADSGEDPYTPMSGIRAIRAANKDKYGNPDGPQYDLARDGAFKGLQIAVLHLYTREGFNFKKPSKALADKGFKVHRWADNPPSASELNQVLSKSCQLWVISDGYQKLNAQHVDVIREFFESGRGVYIWGDNNPFYADANYLADALFAGSMYGNTLGDKIIKITNDKQRVGMVAGHPICTGLECLYEGITIATVKKNTSLQPVAYGSAGKLIIASYDQAGKRALLDGGFTRLYNKWDTAGTARYVKNAAAWLVNYERFGASVFSIDPR